VEHVMSLREKMTAGRFVVLAEMEPPKGVDVGPMVMSAARLRGRVDALVVPEMAHAVMKMSALGGAVLLQGKGFETVMQVCCRDRNRLALQGDLLAAAALGIANVMVVGGETINHGDHHRAHPVRDIELVDLLDGMQKLGQGRDMAGIELTGSPRFFVGSTVNASASGGLLDLELAELDRKIAAGAEFFVTPPVFDLGTLRAFMKRVGGRRAFIIPAVLLLKSVGMVRYMNRHEKEVKVSESITSRIQKAPDKVRECIRVAAELVVALKEEGYPGVYLSTLGWEEKLGEILDEAGL
jgi:methylenetetrahydrofolate reductase (NADPH)